MPSIINSDSGAVSGSAGLKFVSADDGVLQIQNSGNTAIAIASNKVVTFDQTLIQPTPVFEVGASTNQSVSNGIFTKMTFNTVAFDSHGWWDAGNNRYTPQIAGYYAFNALAYFGGTTFNLLQGVFYLNGNNYRLFYEDRDDTADPVSTTQGGMGYMIVYLNGTTDYVEAWARNYSTSPTFLAGRRFSGNLISRAS